MDQPSNAQDKTSATFWKRLTKRDQVALVVFSLNIIVTLALVLFAMLAPDDRITLGGRIAMLTGNVLVLMISLQFAVNRSFDDQEDKLRNIREEIDLVNTRIHLTLEELQGMNVLGETYIRIYRLDDKIKSLYQNSLDVFLNRLRTCIDDKRSGALDTSMYYEVLTELADELLKDKHAQKETNTEIWALTFCLDNEWDDGDVYERMWFSKLRSLDAEGISTKRLWAFDKKMLEVLSKDGLDGNGEELLNRLKMYCSCTNDYKNTTSYAILKSEISDEHIKLFGKGFFAGKFSDGRLSLIRGVCFDNLLSSNTLGGEIDFCAQRISTIRHHWENYLKLAEPLNSFLFDRSGEFAKERMRELGYKEAAIIEGDKEP